MSSTFKTQPQGLGFFGAVGKWIKFNYLDQYIDQHKQLFLFCLGLYMISQLYRG